MRRTEVVNAAVEGVPTAPTVSPARERARAVFLASLADTCQVARSARAARIDRSTAYAWRESDPAFAAAWDAALTRAAGLLEGEAIRRAVDGTLRPVFQGGVKVGSVREYSDSVLIQLLKAHGGEKYRDRSEIQVSGSFDLSIRLQRARERVSDGSAIRDSSQVIDVEARDVGSREGEDE